MIQSFSNMQSFMAYKMIFEKTFYFYLITIHPFSNIL